jgi:hypothetical protein
MEEKLQQEVYMMGNRATSAGENIPLTQRSTLIFVLEITLNKSLSFQNQKPNLKRDV